MDEEIITSGDTDIEKHIFHLNKSSILINNIDTNKVSFGKNDFKYFIGYKDVKKVRPVTLLQKMTAYRIDFDETKCMSFFEKR